MNNKIAILGPYGVGNIGDEAIVEAMIQNIKRRDPDVCIYGININPDDTMIRHAIPSFPIHRHYISSIQTKNDSIDCEENNIIKHVKSLIKSVYPLYWLFKLLYNVPSYIKEFIGEMAFYCMSYKSIKGFDIIIVNGSGQLCDLWHGAWHHPYGLLKWGIISRVAKVKYAVVSVGAGPIDSPLSRIFIKCTLNLAKYVSYRNNKSKLLVESIGGPKKGLVFPDIAFSLPVVECVKKVRFGTERPIIGVNPMAYYDPRCWPKQDIDIYRNYIKRLAKAVSWILSNDNSVLLFSSDRMDRRAIEDVKEIIREDVGNIHGLIYDPPISALNELLSYLTMTEMVIATRLHGLLLSSVLYKPLIAVSPQLKVDYLMDGLGQQKCCLDINRFDLDSFKKLFIDVKENKNKISSTIKNKISGYRHELEIQYDNLFELIDKKESI